MPPRIIQVRGRRHHSEPGGEEGEDELRLVLRSDPNLDPPLARPFPPRGRLARSHPTTTTPSTPKIAFTSISHAQTSTPYTQLTMSTAESVRIAQLEAELARGEEVRHSLARIATASLHALEQSIHKPVGFWIRESEEQTVDDLLEAPEVERMLATEGTWRRKTVSSTASLSAHSFSTRRLTASCIRTLTQIRPLSRANSPAFASPIVPLRVAVPAEVFDLIGSFADLATASALSQVDFAWLVRSPLVKQLPDYVFQRKSRPHLLSLLAKAVSG